MKKVIAQILAEKGGEDAYRQNEVLAEQLRRHGAEAADAVLDELFIRKAAGLLLDEGTWGSPLTRLIEVVAVCAEPKHAQRLAEMLGWVKEITYGENRQYLMQALKRLGDPSVIPLVSRAADIFRKGAEKFEQECRDTDQPIPTPGSYPGDYHRWDQQDAEALIAFLTVV